MKTLKIIMATLAIGALLLSTGANAQTVADVANTVKDSVKGIPKLIMYICYIAGVALGVQSALKLKEFTESKGQVKLFIPIAFFIGSVLLISMPQLMTTGMQTFGYTKSIQPGSKY